MLATSHLCGLCHPHILFWFEWREAWGGGPDGLQNGVQPRPELNRIEKVVKQAVRAHFQVKRSLNEVR